MQYGRQRGCKGVALLPIEAKADWGLNLANLDVAVQLIEDPDADVTQLLGAWMQQRYGERFDDWLIEAMLASEQILADIASYNGISNMVNFDCFRKANAWTLGISKGYLWPMFEAFPDAKERFDLTEAGMGRALATWNRRVRQAKQYHDRVKAEMNALPKSARADVAKFFDRLAVLSLYTSLHQKLCFTRMALEMEQIKPSRTLTRLMERWDYQIYYLIASDADIRDASFTNKHTKPQLQTAGWRYPDITEKDAFPSMSRERETVVEGWADGWYTGDPDIFD